MIKKSNDQSTGLANQLSNWFRRGQPRHGIIGLLQSMRVLGVKSIGRRIAWLSIFSFLAGLAQAGIIIVLSDVAINSAQGKNHIRIVSSHVSIDRALLIALALVVVYLLAGLVAAKESSSLSSYALQNARETIINQFFGASWAAQSTDRLGEVQQMLTVNAERVSDVMGGLTNGIQAFLNLTALLLAAFVVNPLSAASILIVGAALFLALRPFNRWTRRAAGQMSRDSRTMATMTTEYTRLAREFRLLGVEQRATKRLQNSNEVAAQSFQRTRRLSNILPVVYTTVTFVFVLLGMGLLASQGPRNLTSIGAVLLLILRSLSYGAQLQTTSQQSREYGAFVDDLNSKLETYGHDSHEVRNISAPNSFDIQCDRLSFSYDGKNAVLREISFKAANGQIIGVVGHSGSGKTTLAQLLLGMRSPTSGELLVGGVRPSRLLITGGVSPVAIVAQDPVLLRGSIESNVAFFRDVSKTEIEGACKAAHIHEDIVNMADGYATEVGESGGALSGGQRQRLAIARALVGRPRLLVLDEPTSALDGRSERLIRRSLDELRGHITVVIISHRLVTIDICDLILVLENGRLADFGPCEVVQHGAAFRNVSEVMMTEVIQPDPPSDLSTGTD